MNMDKKESCWNYDSSNVLKLSENKKTSNFIKNAHFLF